ncbi:hypothetical protein CPC08DRAFT_689904 [Agrocybe pediades]|nr:hypothetical protein CPC08DRAFT_689904 [Agrocybe pediades]
MHDSASVRFTGTTMASGRFSQSTHLIPSPGEQGKPPKRFEPLIMRLPFVIGTPLLLFLLGAALEIATFLSGRNGNSGFRVPQNNVFNVFGDVSGQFLASFIPTLIIMPNAFAWRELDWNIRWYQPYIVLHKGNAKAEESLLLDYIALGPFLALFRAMAYKHRIVFWSSLTAVVTYAFQPLAGSIFQIRTGSQMDSTTVTSIQSVGLSPQADISDLNAFIAAAGYVDASVLFNLPDPPFVEGGWATAEVIFPSNPFLNGTLSVTTAGVKTNANCSNPSETPILTPVAGTATTLNLTSKSIEGCVANTTFDPSVATLQYGVEAVTSCTGKDIPSLEIQFRPVMFWFFNTKPDNTQEVKTIFCTPIVTVAEVEVFANLNDGSIVNVTQLGDFKLDNNVTGLGTTGKPAPVFNGVIFNDSSNPFIQARAVATRSVLSGAIFKAAQQLPNGPQSTFDRPTDFLDLTSTYYTRHLSTAAKSVYFVGQNTTLTANVVSLVPRLVIDPLPAHALAILLIFTGIVGVALHVLNRRQRKKLILATPPGSIASIVALTARSGFGELLLPYDDELTLEKKLDGIRFRLDRRTGAIVADDYESERMGMDRDDAMLSLLGKNPGDAISATEHSSSYLAYQAAGGNLAWERSWEPTTNSGPSTPLPSKTEYVP